MSVLLKADKISYSVKGKNILKEISFELSAGEILGISGESGSGKTTLAKVIAGLVKPTFGKFGWNSSKSNSGSSVQLLFQNNGEILNPYRRIDDVIKESLLIHNTPKNEITKRVEELFNETGIKPELYSRRGYELSGGEQQRAALARLLAANPELLILDEPFSAQDLISQSNFVSLIKKINSGKNISIICISHDLKIMRKIADTIIVLHNGEIVENNECNELFSYPKHPYTKFLLSSENLDLSYEQIKSNLDKISG
jgi:ABC-type dipeptide/oligopeptide/nickel transport system ATPase subunit